LSFIFFFFFSSRRRHTRLQGDWSSDVCSSDLLSCVRRASSTAPLGRPRVLVSRSRSRLSSRLFFQTAARWPVVHERVSEALYLRSEERRVGKECRCRWGGGD